jgi:formate hydrogenlyase subunit 3/multisubunit Na+/H+ antiporter MnhD subunit
MSSVLLPVLGPLVAALIAAAWPRLARTVGLAAGGLTLASAVLLLVRVAGSGTQSVDLGGWAPPLGIALVADPLAGVMVLMTAVVGLAISVYAPGYYGQAHERGFWPLWLALWAALNALFLSADLFNLYVTLELVGLGAVALAVLDGKRTAMIAGLRYLTVGLLGSLAYLLGVALIYAAYGRLDLGGVEALAGPTPPAWLALTLMSTGLLLKAALFPLHFWLPPAHASASAPVSAALSALVVKAAFYLVARLWLDAFPDLVTPSAAALLTLLGAGAVLWGSWRALRAARLKLMAAYSTVAQLGYLFLFLPLILATPATQRGTVLAAALLLALTHALAKTGLFLATGLIQKHAGHDRIADLNGTAQRLPAVTFAIALAGAALIGLPPSGAFLGKWFLLSAAFQTGHWGIVLVVVAGTLLAAAYVFRVLTHAFGRVPPPGGAGPVTGPGEVTVLTLGVLATFVLGLAAAPLWDLFGGGGP